MGKKVCEGFLAVYLSQADRNNEEEEVLENEVPRGRDVKRKRCQGENWTKKEISGNRDVKSKRCQETVVKRIR